MDDEEGHLDVLVYVVTTSSCQLGFLGASHGYCPVLSLAVKWIKSLGAPVEWNVEHICAVGWGRERVK